MLLEFEVISNLGTPMNHHESEFKFEYTVIVKNSENYHLPRYEMMNPLEGPLVSVLPKFSLFS